MDTLVSNALLSLGIAISISLIVAFRAGKAPEINSINLEERVNDLAVGVLKEKIVSQLEILFRVYRDTTEDLNLPPEVNLQEVASRLFFRDQNIPWLNQIYLDLVNQGTQSPHFAHALDYVLHFGGM